MSPYLIHMTGKAAIAAILRGDNAPPGLEEGCGFLQAGIPSQSTGNFYAEVVCFTESPSFAIDFFRYRSYPRWRANLLYGVGFAKAQLVAEGVMPALYLSQADTARLVTLYDAILTQAAPFAPGSLEQRMQAFVESIYPLCTPLLEQVDDQGFSWEREWRYPHPPGFAFARSDVRVICCPAEEQDELVAILGADAAQVRFVRTWTEFSDVTDFLARQQQVWAMPPADLAKAKRIAALEQLVQGKKIALHSIEGYLHKLEQAATELAKATEMETALTAEIATLEGEIAQLKQ